jgi:iron transport multicopper oxidase
MTDTGHRFTARGIVALVFSCISGIMGVVVIVWYGLAGSETDPGLRGTVTTVASSSEKVDAVPETLMVPHDGGAEGHSVASGADTRT